MQYAGFPTLKDALKAGSSEGWCVTRNCTTCGCPEMRALLGEPMWPAHGGPSYEQAKELAHDLARLSRAELLNEVGYERLSWIYEATMWLIYGIWRHFGEIAHRGIFPVLSASWAGGIYENMKTHYAMVQEAQRVHSLRQGLKKKDWPE